MWGGVLVVGRGLDDRARATSQWQGLQHRDPHAPRRPGSGDHHGHANDNLSATITARAAHGPVGVFDPEGLAAGVPSALRWSPVRGCERPQTAMIRANALCAESAGGTESGSFWKQQTTMAVRCLLHAAALEDRPPVDLYRWSLSPAAAKEAVDILVHTPGAALAWDKALDAIVSADQRQRDSVWAMVANAFAALADPCVLDAVSPGPGETFDPAVFLRQRGTLYLLGTASGASATAGLVAALVEDVVDVARRLAARSTGARLDPPLGLILDEAANYPLPSLGALMSEGGGTGITTLAVLQSLAQARHRWGREQAQGIWDSAIVKIVLGGGSNADDLADIARLVGDRTEPEVSQTAQSGGGRSISTSTRERAISTPPPFGRLLRAMGCSCCVRLDRSCSPSARGRPAPTPTSYSAIGPRSKMPFAAQADKVGRAMRKPRPGLPWSTRRIHRRAAYCNYMASQQWFALRERWAADWVARHGSEPRCLICDVEWALCDDLHHRTYDHLGAKPSGPDPALS